MPLMKFVQCIFKVQISKWSPSASIMAVTLGLKLEQTLVTNSSDMLAHTSLIEALTASTLEWGLMGQKLKTLLLPEGIKCINILMTTWVCVVHIRFSQRVISQQQDNSARGESSEKVLFLMEIQSSAQPCPVQAANLLSV